MSDWAGRNFSERCPKCGCYATKRIAPAAHYCDHCKEVFEDESESERRARSLIHTSVHDCQIDLQHIHDLPFLEGLLIQLRGMEGHASRRQVVERRIRQLTKEG